mgnify:CR=1 FL=1
MTSTAALPNTPDSSTWKSGGSGGMQTANGRATWAGRYQDGHASGMSGERRARFPHIKDLQDQAAQWEVDENCSVSAAQLRLVLI